MSPIIFSLHFKGIVAVYAYISRNGAWPKSLWPVEILPAQGYCFTADRILLKQQQKNPTARLVCLELAVCDRCSLSYVPEVC